MVSMDESIAFIGGGCPEGRTRPKLGKRRSRAKALIVAAASPSIIRSEVIKGLGFIDVFLQLLTIIIEKIPSGNHRFIDDSPPRMVSFVR